MSSDLICYVLSLESAVQRRAAISASLAELDIPFEFVNGIDARQVDVSQHPDVDSSIPCDFAKRFLSPGELACSLGHNIIYRKFLASDAKYALIFEDDAIVTADLRHLLDGNHYKGARLLMLNHYLGQAFGYGSKKLFGVYRSLRAANSPCRTCAYIVDRKTAQKLVDANTPVHALADWPMPADELGCRVIVPMLVEHPPENVLPSLIGERGTAEQPVKCKRRFSDYFTAWYWKRKWRRWTAYRVS